MLEIKKYALEHAVEYFYPRQVVKDLFKEYENSFKFLRNPTQEQIEEYREILGLYTNYTNRREYGR